MAVYKDKNRGTWYASILYVDWTGERCRKLKRGFATEYYVAAEPPVRRGESHLSGQTEPPCY